MKLAPSENAVSIRVPRTARVRGSVTYCKLLHHVTRDPIWGGYRFDGELVRPGSAIDSRKIPEAGVMLECAGGDGKGYGHRRSETLYILWQYEDGEFREVARSASANRDWTMDLGPIARRLLHPPRPVRIDPGGIAERLLRELDREMEPLEDLARKLIVNAVYDRLASRMVS